MLLRDKVVIVIDILFATSTLAHVLAEGALEVRLAYDEDDAYQLRGDVETPLLAGEYNATDGLIARISPAWQRDDQARRSPHVTSGRASAPKSRRNGPKDRSTAQAPMVSES